MSVEIEKKIFNQIIVYDNFAHTLKSEHLHGGHEIYNFSTMYNCRSKYAV